MKLRSMLMLLGGFISLGGLFAHAADQAGFAGTWTIDAARSSSISPWEKSVLTFSAAADEKMEIRRDLSWGEERKATDKTLIKTDGHTVISSPIGFWLDTWYSNLYAGGDGQKKVTAQWLVPGKVLKLETDLLLEGQQGDRPVHIYDEYRLSADGRTLMQIQVRSSRDRALTYIYTRK